jgi:hypothetical protein
MSTRTRRARSLLVAVALASLAAACCPPAPPAAPCPCAEKTASKAAAVDKGPQWLVEDFESPGGLSGGLWFEHDRNPLGTQANPDPFVLTPGGSPQSSGSCAHIWGKLGANRAPWSWVQLQVKLNRAQQPVDLSAYKSVRFAVKGDGGRYGIAFVKAAVTDYDEYHYEFAAPGEWTQIEVPFSELRQHGWGKAVPQVFDDVKHIQFYPAQHEQPFDLYVDHVVLAKTAAPREPIAYDTKHWFPWTGFDPRKRKGTALDVSRLLDGPAGKHGPLGARGEDFVFKDGTTARFIGINLVASENFPTHAEADQLVELLAEMGVNITRHHHMDAAWSQPNIFGNRPTTLELDPELMDRFDYLIDQLQKRGIYQFFDMLVHRKVTEADGVPGADSLVAGLKIEGEFDAKLIELQERFVEQFMGHRNPYTQRTYAKDPAVALVEVINEDSLLWLQPEGDFSVKTPEGKALFNSLFSKWLTQNVGERAALAKRWGGGSGLAPEEDPAKGNVNAVVSVGKGAEKELSPARAADTLRFFYDTMLGYYRKIGAKLKSLGYRGLIAGSNHWTDHPLDLKLNAELDFVDRHAYWSHPEGGWGYKTSISWDPSPMVKDMNLGIIGSLARRRVRGLPYSCSEWQTAAPNDTRQEGLLLVASIASLQGWSPLQFAFSHQRDKSVDSPGALESNFDVIEQPAMLGAWPAAALLFHRGDVRPSEVDAYLKVARESLTAPGASLSPPPQLALVARTGVDFRGGQPLAALEALRAKHVEGDWVRSNTGEIRHNAKLGLFEIDTPRTQGFVGFKSDSPVELGNASIVLKSPFAVVAVTSLDDQPIASSEHWLVTALGNAVNSGMKLDPSGNRLADPGHSPVLVEPIAGSVTLKKLVGSGAGLHAYALDAAGGRAKEIGLTATSDGATLELSADHRTMHYEVVR